MYRLGIDTSFYTASVAALGPNGQLLLDRRRALPVSPGARGARPSDAVFFHVRAMAELAEDLRALPGPPAAVAASVRPRPAPDSYLPVFRVAEGWGRQVAAACGVPFVPVSHQDGHLAAGAWSAGFAPSLPFVAVQISGGTTDVLAVEPAGYGFRETLLGTTADLHGGQFIDRVGVALGLPFPAGPAMDELARRGEPGAVRLPVAVSGLVPSFAGPEAAALRAIAAGARPADVALAALECLTRTVARLIAAACLTSGCRDALVAGGVAANQHLRRSLVRRGRLATRDGPLAVNRGHGFDGGPDAVLPGGGGPAGAAAGAIRIWWPDPHYCTDNAVGAALLAHRALEDLEDRA